MIYGIFCLITIRYIFRNGNVTSVRRIPIQKLQYIPFETQSY